MSHDQSATRTYRITLSTEAEEAVVELATLMGNVPMNEALRQAIGDALFMRRAVAKGWQPLIRRGDEYKEFIWGERTNAR